MNGLNLSGSKVPKARAMPLADVGDFDRALAVLAAGRGDKSTKVYLTELRDGAVAHELAREASEAAGRKAAAREEAAHDAEANVRSQREALATEMAKADDKRGMREMAVAEREHTADAHETALDAQAKELDSREAKIAFREGVVKGLFKDHQKADAGGA